MRFIAFAAVGALAAVGFTPLAAHADPQSPPEPYHPTNLWATSEEPFEGQKNIKVSRDSAETFKRESSGVVGALIDDDVTDPAQRNKVSFWTTGWRGENRALLPQALVVQPNDDRPLCGIEWTGRPNYKGLDAEGVTEGGKTNPGSYTIFGFDTPPAELKDGQDGFAEWQEAVKKDIYEGGTLVARGGLVDPGGLDDENQPANPAQMMALPATSYKAYAIVGLENVRKTEAGLSASDIKLVPCPAGRATPDAAGGADVLDDLIVDQLPLMDGETPVRFSKDRHSYTANAYYYARTASVVTKAPEGTQVTINGKAVDGDGRVVNIPLKDGKNYVEVVAKNGDQTGTYVVTINKTNTDYRGHVRVDNVTAAANNFDAEKSGLLTDGNRLTSITYDTVQRAPADAPTQWSDNLSGFTLTLEKPRWVQRINVFAMPKLVDSAKWWDAGTHVTIQVRESDSGEWTTVSTQAQMRRETKGLMYWDFTVPRKAKQIRVFPNLSIGDDAQNNSTLQSITYEDVDVWALPDGEEPAPQPAKYENSPTEDFDANKAAEDWGISRPQALMIQYNMPMPAWMPAQDMARGSFDIKEHKLMGGPFPMFTNPPLFDVNLMKNLGKGAPWAIAKAPFGGHLDDKTGEPREFFKEGDPAREWTDSLIDIQMGDEEPYNKTPHEAVKKWMEYARQKYPNAIGHTNQAVGTGWNDATFPTYIKNIAPDMLSFDVYPYNSRDAIPNRVRNFQAATNKITRSGHVISPIWKQQRAAALKGYFKDETQDATNPIPYGQYIDYSFDANVSESQKAITIMLGLATGQKWFGMFRIEYNGPDFGSLIDPDGQPTTAFFEYSKIFGDVKGYGTYLTPMTNTYFAVQPGVYSGSDVQGGVPDAFKMGNLTRDDAKAEVAKYGIETVESVNQGTINSKQKGDVAVGTFDVLPGLKAKKLNSIYRTNVDDAADRKAPKAFFVVNGLVGPTRSPEPELFARTDQGSYWETAQDVKLTLKAPEGYNHLIAVDPETFEPVEVIATAPGERADNAGLRAELGENDTINVTIPKLGGGLGRLFYWTSEPLQPVEQPDVSPTNVDKDKDKTDPDTGTDTDGDGKVVTPTDPATDGDKDKEKTDPDTDSSEAGMKPTDPGTDAGDSGAKPTDPSIEADKEKPGKPDSNTDASKSDANGKPASAPTKAPVSKPEALAHTGASAASVLLISALLIGAGVYVRSRRHV